MVTQNKTFQTGKEYCLGDIFNGENKIIIPDLQRDYCWGDKAGLVENFTDNLIELFVKDKNQHITMGLIYGYEEPSHYLQLCDGQQRLTTLFLLLGLLNKRTENSFEQYITDNKEPRLQYAIRENTLYFLFDLAGNFFAGDNTTLNVEDIRKQPWYFKDYDVDPSIQSMLKALDIIDKRLTSQTIKDKYKAFGEFLIDKIFFLYYDMENRRNGEETFVIINTTGEPLTETENLKPLMLSKITNEEKQKSASKDWEQWEDFFWQNRHKNDTADIGLKEFFRWVVLLQFDIINDNKTAFQNMVDSMPSTELRKIDLETVKKYFSIITFLFDKELIDKFDSYLAPQEQNDQITLFKILPVIEYIARFGQSDIENIKRVIRFFFNLSRVDNMSKAISEQLPEALKIIKKLPNTDITSLLKLKDEISKTLLTDEEAFKLALYKTGGKERQNYEKRFWAAEDHHLWKGEIKPLLQWSCRDGVLDSSTFDVARFDEYDKTVRQIFYNGPKDRKLDITRRALLTILPSDNYPKIFRGNTNYSFCWEYKDWKTLIYENNKGFQSFLDILKDKSNIQNAEKDMITKCIDDIKGGKRTLDYDLDKFLIYPEMLAYCRRKNIQWYDETDNWILIPKIRATTFRDLETYVFYLELIPPEQSQFLTQNLTKDRDDEGYRFTINSIHWKIWFYAESNDGNCCVFSKEDNSCIIDCAWEKKNNGIDIYAINLRNGKNENKTKSEFSEFAKQLGMHYSEARYRLSDLHQKDVHKIVEKIITDLSH
ncbi:DUF262 domain-containing protein [Treponema sp. OMZ 305]|uniref:DUF262 domain-containing protein n=1 Tax=Treponema sp. OMZ 305 TaxID=1659192 RepID=UPI0020A3222A|nr:DUF262 domain-containing protein [Treponema sp. OMZ 305]UTC57898.1 DUF262 domain-containing protein [Treponema sp. OMZ 305]